MLSRGKLIRESEWMRVYESVQWGRVHESKFLSGEAEISARSIAARWPGMPLEERLEFANAFAVKPVLSVEDEEIVDFLMRQSGEMLSSSIATMVAKLRDKKRAASFLVECLSAFPKSRANFLCALADLAVPEAASNLLSVYKECSEKIKENASDYESVADLLYCAAALYRTTREPEYINLITSYSHHPDDRVRYQAENAMRWATPKG